MAPESRSKLLRQTSKDSTDGSVASLSTDSGSQYVSPLGGAVHSAACSWSNLRMGTDGQYGDFVEGLGPAQLVGRYVLAVAGAGHLLLQTSAGVAVSRRNPTGTAASKRAT